MKSILRYFSLREILLWLVSVLSVVISFCVFDGESYSSNSLTAVSQFSEPTPQFSELPNITIIS